MSQFLINAMTWQVSQLRTFRQIDMESVNGQWQAAGGIDEPLRECIIGSLPKSRVVSSISHYVNANKNTRSVCTAELHF